MRRMARSGAMAVLAAMALGVCGEAPGASPESGVRAPLLAGPCAPVDDQEIQRRLIARGEELLARDQATKAGELRGQLQRRQCRVKLPARAGGRTGTADWAGRIRTGVLVVGRFYKCTKCGRWHINAASGAMLTADGVAVTARHVVKGEDFEQLLVMTGDGRIAPVREVLAADESADLAVLKVEGTGFAPLRFGHEAAVGARVRVFSHPDGNFYTLSEGIVSRYFTREAAGKKVAWMGVTADFAQGSSGAPVLDEQGGLVGIALSTATIFYHQAEGQPAPPQMVLKTCAPVAALRELLGTSR